MLNLQKGQKVLDIGGGIGGSAFYMAKVKKLFIYRLMTTKVFVSIFLKVSSYS